MRSHDSGETWVGAVSCACSAVASKNKVATKCLCNSTRCLQSQYLQRTLKFFADRCFMQLCINVIMKSIFFQYRCLRWISSWEWVLYLIVQITSLQTYHYEQVGTLTIWWCYCPADSSCLFSFEKFLSEPFFVYRLECHKLSTRFFYYILLHLSSPHEIFSSEANGIFLWLVQKLKVSAVSQVKPGQWPKSFEWPNFINYFVEAFFLNLSL